jgi:hypothetical protein
MENGPESVPKPKSQKHESTRTAAREPSIQDARTNIGSKWDAEATHANDAVTRRYKDGVER